MPLAYSCGTQIEKLETISSIKGLYLDIQNNGCKIPISMVTNDATFGMLSALWLEECIHFMWWYGNGIPEGLTEDLKAPDEFLEREIGCFYEKAGEKERADFLCRYKEALTDQDFPDICNSKRADDIFQEIDRKIGEARSYLILRVKAVCLLTNCRPEELFEEGQGWTDSIPIKSDDYFELSNNMVFALDPMGEKEIDLVPKTLRNDSGSSCTIYVSYFDKDHTENNRQYSITLPPYGILRVVFTNRDLRKLAFVKGNISCADAERAIVQSGEENGIQLYYVRKLEKPLAFPHIEFYRDAAADAMGGAVILGSREFYSTVTSKTYLEKGKDDLPIRCFRSGRQWARLYSNGRLESEFVNDRELDGVTAVAEDGDRGLLICRKGEAYDYRGDGLSKPISLENFWDIMMERFSGDGCCETVRTQLTRFTVNKSRIKAESI